MDDELIAYGTEVKALGGGKIGGYLVRFSDASQPDLTGDYFDAKTAINMPDDLPLLYNHGMDGTLKKRVIGRVKTKADDVGVWADAQMDLRDEYEKIWQQILDEAAQAGLIPDDTTLLRKMLFGSLNWTVQWFRPSGNLSIEQLADRMLRLIMR